MTNFINNNIIIIVIASIFVKEFNVIVMENKSYIKQLIKTFIFMLFGYLILLLMYHMINTMPKTEGINYGAIIYIFMLVISAALIIKGLFSSIKLIYSLVKNIINEKKDGLYNKNNVIFLIISIILLIMMILYFVFIEMKVFLK